MTKSTLNEHKYRFNIVVPFYNVSEWITWCVRSVKAQKYENYRCFLVDDISTDNTVEMLKSYTAPFNIKWIDTGETEKYCLAKVRNMAIVETTGQAVAIIDDDSFPVPEFIAAHKKSAERGVITGGYRNSHDPKDSLHPKMKRTLLKYGINRLNPITERIVENNA